MSLMPGRQEITAHEDRHRPFGGDDAEQRSIGGMMAVQIGHKETPGHGSSVFTQMPIHGL